jgi:hypothetical protein
MGKTFEKIRLCSVGKLQDADKIPQWVRANGGDYTKNVDSRTTHLVTTKEAYKQNLEVGQFSHRSLTLEQLWSLMNHSQRGQEFEKCQDCVF